MSFQNRAKESDSSNVSPIATTHESDWSAPPSRGHTTNDGSDNDLNDQGVGRRTVEDSLGGAIGSESSAALVSPALGDDVTKTHNGDQQAQRPDTNLPPSELSNHHVIDPSQTQKSAQTTANDVPNSSTLQQVPLQRPSQLQRNFTFFTIVKFWCLELFGILLAAVIVTVEVVLLAHYNDKNVRRWNHEWAINSVFAFLTAILEAAVAFAIGSCLGQLRWIWYQKSDSELKWMDRLTNARSPPGAFRFVISHGAYKRWAGLGALLVLSLLGVGVFTQNVITIRGTVVERTQNYYDPSSVPVANTYNHNWQFGSSGYRPGDQQPYVWMISAIQAGFTFPSDSSTKDTVINLVYCSTGNCTLGQYSTLSLCSKCADISDQIECRDGNCPTGSRLRLPDDSVSLNPNYGIVNITSDTTYPNSSVLGDIGPLVVRYQGLGFLNNYNLTPPYATECALYWCVNTYNATVKNTNFEETQTNTWTNLTAPATVYGQDTPIVLSPEECFWNGTRADAESGQCDFGVDPLSQRALQNYLVYGEEASNTPGFLTGNAVLASNSTSGYNWIVSGLAANAIISPCTASTKCTSTMYSLFQDTFNSMAHYMANEIRKVQDTGPGYSYGSTLFYDTHFHVRWGWLTYPIAIVLISFIFLVVTMYKSRHTNPWKTSVTALLFHGLTDADKGAHLYLDDPEEMKHATEDWIVRLQDENGTRSFRKKGSVAWALHVPEEGPHALAQIGAAALKGAESL